MSEGGIQSEYRRKRINRLKKCIIVMLMAVLIFPLVLCVCMLVRMNGLNRALEDMASQVDRLTGVTERQQELLEQLSEELQAMGRQVSVSSSSIGQQFEDKTEKRDAGRETDTNEQLPKETSESTAAHKVYLTFDDGPSIYTQEILDILDSYDVKATFFVLGKETDAAKDALKRIVEDGHTLGMHSYSHRYSEVYASVESFAEDFTKLRDYLYEVTGVKSTVYRFPGGSSNTVSKIPMKEFAEYLEEQDVVFFDWNIASGDGGVPLLSVETLVENSLKGIAKYETSVILMHDSADKRTTVDALATIIENILAMEDTVILPITEDTKPVQHRHWSSDTEGSQTEEGMEE